jgi:hypothetical protein
LWKGTSRSHQALSACRAPAGPAAARQGRKPRSGGARAPAFTGRWRSGSIAITPPALSAEPPFDAAIRARDASDVLADPFFKNRKPSPSSIIAIGPSDLRRGTDIPAKFEHPSPSKDRGVSCLYSHFKDLDVKPRDSAPIHINSLQQNCKSNACQSKSPGVSALFKKRSGVRVRGPLHRETHYCGAPVFLSASSLAGLARFNNPPNACVCRKLKPERSGDEVRPRGRLNL